MKQEIVIKISQILLVVMSMSFSAGTSHARDINRTAIPSGTEQNIPRAILLNSGKKISIERLVAGGQAVIQGLSDTIIFAGQNIDFAGFSGVLGMASDTAYIMVARGQAHIGGQEAGAGEIFILLPYGGEIIKQHFDAGRFINVWSETDQEKNPVVFRYLKDMAEVQSTAMFFGRYEATAFNVSAPGSADREEARRSIVGADVIQDIRFSGEKRPEKIEQRVVMAYAKALVSGDMEKVAALTDPGPYGTFDLRGGAAGARLLMAKQVIRQHDWQNLIGGMQFVKLKGKQYWVLSRPEGTVTVVLRPIGDFIYVKNIAWEAGQ